MWTKCDPTKYYFYCTLIVVLSWPEDGRSRPKHVAKYNLTVIIASCLDVSYVLTVHNILYKSDSITLTRIDFHYFCEFLSFLCVTPCSLVQMYQWFQQNYSSHLTHVLSRLYYHNGKWNMFLRNVLQILPTYTMLIFNSTVLFIFSAVRNSPSGLPIARGNVTLCPFVSCSHPIRYPKGLVIIFLEQTEFMAI